MSKSIRWAAKLDGVREVSIAGAADLDYWKTRLASEGLSPAESEGAARLMLVACDARFKGVRFRELSVSIELALPVDDSLLNASLLIRAFNSNRLFAFCERVLFRTPYAHADVSVQHDWPMAIRVATNRGVEFQAEMGVRDSAIATKSDPPVQEDWNGRILLPRGEKKAKGGSRFFYAQLAGEALRIPFNTDCDRLEIDAQASFEVFRALAESGFTPQQWIVRSDARHAKSKTYAQHAAPDSVVFDQSKQTAGR